MCSSRPARCTACGGRPAIGPTRRQTLAKRRTALSGGWPLTAECYRGDWTGKAALCCHLFAGLEAKDLDELSPVERRKFGDRLRHWDELAERGRRVEPQVGVLGALRCGRCHD